ncbi:hypothetical protein HDU93_008662 [Gonapodya sp. JEL0774]|nr:hypothetical protein HDU93_008662 [Gonapodya sp. JEL0774]
MSTISSTSFFPPHRRIRSDSPTSTGPTRDSTDLANPADSDSTLAASQQAMQSGIDDGMKGARSDSAHRARRRSFDTKATLDLTLSGRKHRTLADPLPVLPDVDNDPDSPTPATLSHATGIQTLAPPPTLPKLTTSLPSITSARSHRRSRTVNDEPEPVELASLHKGRGGGGGLGLPVVSGTTVKIEGAGAGPRPQSGSKNRSLADTVERRAELDRLVSDLTRRGFKPTVPPLPVPGSSPPPDRDHGLQGSPKAYSSERALIKDIGRIDNGEWEGATHRDVDLTQTPNRDKTFSISAQAIPRPIQQQTTSHPTNVARESQNVVAVCEIYSYDQHIPSSSLKPPAFVDGEPHRVPKPPAGPPTGSKLSNPRHLRARSIDTVNSTNLSSSVSTINRSNRRRHATDQSLSSSASRPSQSEQVLSTRPSAHLGSQDTFNSPRLNPGEGSSDGRSSESMASEAAAEEKSAAARFSPSVLPTSKQYDQLLSKLTGSGIVGSSLDLRKAVVMEREIWSSLQMGLPWRSPGRATLEDLIRMKEFLRNRERVRNLRWLELKRLRSQPILESEEESDIHPRDNTHSRTPKLRIHTLFDKRKWQPPLGAEERQKMFAGLYRMEHSPHVERKPDTPISSGFDFLHDFVALVTREERLLENEFASTVRDLEFNDPVRRMNEVEAAGYLFRAHAYLLSLPKPLIPESLAHPLHNILNTVPSEKNRTRILRDLVRQQVTGFEYLHLKAVLGHVLRISHAAQVDVVKGLCWALGAQAFGFATCEPYSVKMWRGEKAGKTERENAFLRAISEMGKDIEVVVFDAGQVQPRPASDEYADVSQRFHPVSPFRTWPQTVASFTAKSLSMEAFLQHPTQPWFSSILEELVRDYEAVFIDDAEDDLVGQMSTLEAQGEE